MKVNGDIQSLSLVTSWLPHSTFYAPPKNVTAVRNGSTVKVSWGKVKMTVDDDRGYMIEAWICQKGSYFPAAFQTDTTSIEIKDEPGCNQDSSGKLYTVDKHGYSDPVDIPWP